MNKSILLGVSLVFSSILGYAQTDTYLISNNAGATNISDYETVMDVANFDSYRFIDKRRILTFDSGVIIELLSVNEIKQLNLECDETKALSEDLPVGYPNPLLRLTSAGHIILEYPTLIKEK